MRPGRLLAMRSGVIVGIDDPDWRVLRIEDVAAQLSAINRWLGVLHTNVDVATHSCVVADVVYERHGSAALAAAALIHDAPEAILGDVTYPLKRLLGEPYTEREEAWAVAMIRAFGGYDWRGCEHIKQVDTLALFAEARAFGNPSCLEVVRLNLGLEPDELPDSSRMEQRYRDFLACERPAEGFLRRWARWTA